METDKIERLSLPNENLLLIKDPGKTGMMSHYSLNDQEAIIRLTERCNGQHICLRGQKDLRPTLGAICSKVLATGD